MSADTEARRFLALLDAENRWLAAGNAEGAAAMLVEKQQAAAALTTAMKAGPPAPDLLAELKLRTEENARHLRLALSVQSRILEMVAHAAVASSPGGGYGRYGGRGSTAVPRTGGIALAMRA